MCLETLSMLKMRVLEGTPVSLLVPQIAAQAA